MGITTDRMVSQSASDDSDTTSIHVFWLSGGGCDGCSISMLGATDPGIEDLLAGTVPDLPAVKLHHPLLAIESGTDYVDHLRAAAHGTRDPYLVVVEGSVPNEQRIDGDGYWITQGEEDGEPVRMVEWLDRLAPGAAAVIAIGTCASWGGVPAAAGNPTDAMGTMDYLGRDYRSTLDLPVINVPGCAPVGDNFTELVTHLLLYVEDIGPLPTFDTLGRPEWLFGETVHRNCDRGSDFEEAAFAQEYGSEQCLVELGCWGPVVKCNMATRGNLDGVGGCMDVGGKCIGCTMPGFPDKFTPFFEKPPLHSNAMRLLGGVLHRFRQRTIAQMEREARSDDPPGIDELAYQWLLKREGNYDRNPAWPDHVADLVDGVRAELRAAAGKERDSKAD